MSSKINEHVLRYIEMVEKGEVEACEEQHLLVKYVSKCFETEDIYTDEDQLEKYLSLVKYFPYEKLFEWEIFCLALHCCTYRAQDGMPRWPEEFLLMGRGGGKDGYMAFESFCLMSPYNGIRNYDIDICANNEEQAKMPFNDVLSVLEEPKQRKKLLKHFYWNKEVIKSLKTSSKLKFRTNSPKGKDGLRSGAVIFNEIHQYQDYENINVFTTGLGKKPHPRKSYITTNGDVRDGPLDHYLEKSEAILRGEIPDNGWLPFICKLDDKKEVHDKAKWEKANPSIRYLPNLREEMEREYVEWKTNPSQFSAFMTKRMNIPDGNKDVQITDWENIKATNRTIPDLIGWSCVVGLDYTKVTDLASVNLHFRDGDLRYDINHSWLCLKSHDLPRLKIPWREWADQGLLTLVDDVEIPPELIVAWITEQATKYNIVKIALDNYRYALMASALRNIGFDAKEYKNVKLVRPSDIMQIQPVIDSCFVNQRLIWGDNPLFRWGANNTKLIKSGVRSGNFTGNYVYGKIEPKSRKTDPFMAFVASMTIEEELGDGRPCRTPDVGVFVY